MEQVSNEDLIGWMGDRCYKAVCESLQKEIYELQSKVFEFGSHDEVVEARGYCKGLAFLVNLRDLLEAQQTYEEGGFDEETV